MNASTTAKPAKTPRTRPGRLTLIGGALAALGLIVAVAVTLQGGGGGRGGASVPQTTVLVAAQSLHYRQVVKAGDVTTRQMATADVPSGAYTQVSDLKNQGSVATVNIPSGTVITASQMVKSADALIGVQVPSFLPIPPGYVAMTIPTSEEQGVAGYIQPGDYITIVATHATVARTVYTQVHVIRIGLATFGTSGATPAPNNIASSLTIVVTQCQSEYIIWLLANTQLRYDLEASSDYVGTADNSSCPTVDSASGVSTKDINAKWPGLA